jgi:hypothetical protein
MVNIQVRVFSNIVVNDEQLLDLERQANKFMIRVNVIDVKVCVTAAASDRNFYTFTVLYKLN